MKFFFGTLSPALFLAAIPAHAGVFSVSPWTGDSDSGLDILTNYTAVADFVGDGTRVVNGVAFTNTGATGTGASSYQLLGAPDSFNANGNALTGSSNLLASDFFYSGSTGGNANLTLANLVPGQNYVATWYNAGFGAVGGRFVNITPGDTGVPFLFDQNQSGAGNGNLLTYSFTATAPLITFSFDAISDGDSFHHYALTNAGPSGSSGPLLTVTPTYTGQTGAGPFAPFSPLNNDLLQTSVSGVGSAGDFTQEGTGGVPILTNGAFSITGIGGSNPELATGANGTNVVYDLDLTNAPLGYDISQIIGYGGWNDGGRDRQLFNIYYSVVGDSGFTLLGTADFNPAGNPTQPSAVRSTFDTAITWVDRILIDFPAGQEAGHAGYGEFDVVGTATVPEPGTMALLCFGLTAFAGRRRKIADLSK